MTRARMLLAVLSLLVLAPAARAADQVTTDPDDAYVLAAHQSDVRAVEFHTDGTNVTATVRMERTAQYAAFLFLDVDRNGRADYALDVDGSDTAKVYDAQLYAVPNSTTSCQLYDPGVAPLVDQQPVAVTDADGFAVLSLTFPASAIGGAGSWTWAAFGYTDNSAAMQPPGWDYVPDATNPDTKVAQPADRGCSITQVPGTGEQLAMTQGVAFPTPPLSNATPSASFTYSPGAPHSGDPVTFTSTASDSDGHIVSERWDLDDDGLYDDASGHTVTTSFDRKGPHAVHLIVEDDAGASATATQTVTALNSPPHAHFTVSPASPLPGQEVVLTSDSTDDGTITAYHWSLPGGATADGPLVRTSFPSRGTYHVALRVTDDDGVDGAFATDVTVADQPPVARLRITPAHPTIRDVITLDASGSTDPEGDHLDYDFDYGSGSFAGWPSSNPRSNSVGGYPRHVTMRVRVRDGHGGTSEAGAVVDIGPPPLGLFIYGPDANTVLYDDHVDLYGSIDRWGGGGTFCVATGDVDAAPAGCDSSSHIARDGTWSVPVHLIPGLNHFTVFATDTYGQSRRVTTVVERATASSGLDLRVTGIEVTQGSQFARLPRPAGSSRVADYNGVILARGGPTYARVFADARSLARGNIRPSNVLVTLTGTDGGRALPGSPLTPMSGPGSLGLGPDVGADVGIRTDPAGAYTFALPDSWTRVNHLQVTATVDPAGAFPQCATCHADDALTVREIVFHDPQRRVVFPVELAWNTSDGRAIRPLPAAQAFDAWRRLTPGGFAATQVYGYYGAPIRIDDIANDASLSADDKNHRTFDRVASFYASTTVPGAYEVGVNTGVARGLTAPVLFGVPLRVDPVMVVESARPLTSVAHELGHAEGFGHASSCTTGADPHFAPGLGVDDWPPDQRGQLDGYALDLRPGSGGRRGPFRVLGPAQYDLMSYCANPNGDPDSWLSARNWNRLMGGPQDQPDRTAARAAMRADAGPLLLVTGALDGTGKASIIRVEPATGPATAASQDPSYQLVVRDAAGSPVSTTAIDPTPIHSHGGSDLGAYFRATVPAAGAASVELDGPSGVLASRKASASPPAVTLAKPSVGKGVLHVAWTASDADRDPLRARVELASDGVTYRVVAIDVAGPSVDVPLAGIVGGRAARVRVTVNDGFRATPAVSAPFALPDGGTTVRILDPAPRSLVRADEVVPLRGEAFTTAGKAVPVTWYAGGRRLGRGPAIVAAGLPAGRVRLRLVARGGASATTTIRVTAVKPMLLSVRRAGPRALRVAANVPATLRLGGRTFAVGRTPRRIAIRARGTLRGTLQAGHARAAVTLHPH